jgi:hypothetical protein
MIVLKGYVRNCANPKGSMIEDYTNKKIIKCYVDYIKNGKSIGVPVSRPW